MAFLWLPGGVGCSRPGGIDSAGLAEPSNPTAGVPPTARVPTFREVQDAAGLRFRHRHGGTGNRYMPETMGAGGGWLDYDDDGLLDVYLVQGGHFPGAPVHDAETDSEFPPGNRLFRNRGDGTFEDVTAVAHAQSDGYAMGACFADVDNDGHIDIYVTQFGLDVLLRNRGDGTFEHATRTAGIAVDGWSTSCAFADVDQDGWLDLYVVRYVDFRLTNHRACGPVGLPQYCHPDVYSGVSDVLLHNRGGMFEDVTAAAGLRVDDPNEAKGLGAIFLDFDDDGDPDLYVSNDSTRNFLYRNEGNGTFAEVGTLAGVAYNELGATEAGMGVAAGDVDGDARLDLFVTNLDFETNTLYRSVGAGLFEDATVGAGLGPPSLLQVGFGTALFDGDLDGDLDLYVANGHILDNVALRNPTQSFAQADQLYLNTGEGGTFADVSSQAGEWFGKARVGRGAAPADYDDDGDIDLLISQNNDRAVLLHNDLDRTTSGHWLGLRLRSRYGGRDAIGATARIVGHTHQGEHHWIRQVHSGAGYLTQGDLRVQVGLGDDVTLERVEIRWPEGQEQTLPGDTLRMDEYQDIFQSGAGARP
jgi:hypothetical protein